MRRVALIFTGGTISMRSSGSGNVPTLRAAELLASVEGLGALAEIEPIDWGLVPASHLSFAQVLDIGRILETQLTRSDIDGAVVVQGTDVMEETAFAWDLLPLPPKPVIVVGAMRSASEDGYDGPDNLRAAVVGGRRSRARQPGRRGGHGRRAPRRRRRPQDSHPRLRDLSEPQLGPLGAVSGGAQASPSRARTPVRRSPGCRPSPCRSSPPFSTTRPQSGRIRPGSSWPRPEAGTRRSPCLTSRDRSSRGRSGAAHDEMSVRPARRATGSRAAARRGGMPARSSPARSRPEEPGPGGARAGAGLEPAELATLVEP